MLSLVKLAIILSMSEVISPFIADPELRCTFDGNLVGLCDLAKHELIPAKYSQIEYAGRGIFIAQTIDPACRFDYGRDKFLFDADGHALSVHLPKGTHLAQVLTFGPKGPSTEGKPSGVPPGTLLRFAKSGRLVRDLANVLAPAKDDRFGICDTKGNILLPAEYTFVGKVSESKSFVQDPKGVVYLFDCNSRSLAALAPGTCELSRLYFSEGLAAICIHPAGGQRRWGYIDKSGTLKIEPKFESASAFKNGMAAVELAVEIPGYVSQVIINKFGKVISPPSLAVQRYHGDLAVASTSDGRGSRFGLVNRNFDFAIPPTYARLEPFPIVNDRVVDNPEFGIYTNNPRFLLATQQGSDCQQLITPDGKTVVLLPPNCFLNYINPNGLLQCHDASDENATVTVPPSCFLDDLGQNGLLECYDANKKIEISVNWEGQRVSPTPDDIHPTVVYSRLTNDRLLEFVNKDDEHFDSLYWKKEYDSPIPRYQMFGRFLIDYDVIGMSRDKLAALLGEGSRPQNNAEFTYFIDGDCEHSLNVVVTVMNNNVQSWHFDESGKQLQVNTTNVVLDLQPNATAVGSIDSPKVKPKYQ
ncbi:MAG TPA: WG repeat-containing protein [Planktothrix sp.]|jgi:hypothetical protein